MSRFAGFLSCTRQSVGPYFRVAALAMIVIVGQLEPYGQNWLTEAHGHGVPVKEARHTSPPGMRGAINLTDRSSEPVRHQRPSRSIDDFDLLQAEDLQRQFKFTVPGPVGTFVACLYSHVHHPASSSSRWRC